MEKKQCAVSLIICDNSAFAAGDSEFFLSKLKNQNCGKNTQNIAVKFYPVVRRDLPRGAGVAEN